MQTLPFPQFCGKDYTPFSAKVDTQQLWNLYRERIQANDAQYSRAVDYVLYKTPGLQTKLNSPGCHRGTAELNDHVFDVVGSTLLDLTGPSVINATLGPIADDGKNVLFAVNTDTLLIVSSGILYAVFGGVLSTPVTPQAPIGVAFIGGYFVLLARMNQIFFSLDGLTWDPLDFQTAEASPSAVLAMVEDHNELWLIGNRVSQVFTVGADPNTPFVPRQDGIVQQGIAAPASLNAMDNGLVWLAENKNGARTFIRMNGFQPETISTYAIENTLRLMPTIDDCIGMSFQLNGHSVCWFTFPTADRTLCYDATEGDWYNVGWWNAPQARYERHRANCIVSAFGTILCGDHANGNLYELSPDYYDDDGNDIRWMRQTPHSTKDGKRIEYGRLTIFAETGMGLDVAPGVRGNDPQITMEFSDNGGKVFSSAYDRSLGKLGEYEKEIFWNRLGIALDRVFRFYGTSPTKIVFTGAAFEAEVLR